MSDTIALSDGISFYFLTKADDTPFTLTMYVPLCNKEISREISVDEESNFFSSTTLPRASNTISLSVFWKCPEMRMNDDAGFG